jgi:hypothetical protein
MVCIIKTRINNYSNIKDNAMRKIIEYILLGIVAGVVIVYVYTFFPKVEEVKYSEQKDDRFKNYLEITVNSKSKLFYGRESFLSFKRDHYTFYFTTRGKTYSEQDIMDISIYGTKNMKIKPQRALVKIENNNSGDIVVYVDIADERIPKLINGSYRLSVAESNPSYVWYKLK